VIRNTESIVSQSIPALEIEDLILSKQYFKAPIKIQWFLRQTYNTGIYDYHSIPSYHLSPNPRRTVKRAAWLSYGLLHGCDDYDECKLRYGDVLTEALKMVSWVNVLDEPLVISEKGDKRSVGNEAGRTFKILYPCNFQKISMVNAEVIIFGGTFHYFWDFWSEERGRDLLHLKFNNPNLQAAGNRLFSCYVEKGLEQCKLFVEIQHPSICTNLSLTQLLLGYKAWKSSEYVCQDKW
jgi:hypothetical protein